MTKRVQAVRRFALDDMIAPEAGSFRIMVLAGNGHIDGVCVGCPSGCGRRVIVRVKVIGDHNHPTLAEPFRIPDCECDQRWRLTDGLFQAEP